MSGYVTMFQNDTQQIDQVLRDYEQAKGLAHGVQKDAIQNGFGARQKKSEPKACEGEWAFFFELKTINNKPALVFWDEGTTGLSGDILSIEEIEERSASDTLGPDQKLGRFLSRFQSGGNTGPGSFGRGKLIFQAASTSHSILIDSLREDQQYISLDRKIIKNQLKQPAVPYVGDAAKSFISEKSGGALAPLEMPGTRVIVLDVDPEIVVAFEMSFGGAIKRANSASFFYMIAETWWEILQMGARIYLRSELDEIRVVLEEDLEAVIEAKNKIGGYRVYQEKNIPVSINSEIYKIKEVRLILAPQTINDDLQEIWVQRKRMKVGGIDRHINKHHKVRKKLSGYIRLDSKLEDLFEEAEGTTHYGFDMRKAALKQVREVVSSKVEEFQRILGFREENTKARLQNELNEALKGLNEMANDLGLPTEFAGGKKRKTASISIKRFVLPDQNTTRVEIGDAIGPITYRLKNYGGEPISGKLNLTFKQGREINHEVFSTTVVIPATDELLIEVPPVRIEKADYVAGSMLMVSACLKRVDTSHVYAQVSRSVWVGIDPPEKDYDHKVDILPLRPVFPHEDTTRVELGEILGGLGFSLSNKSNINLKLNIDVKVRKSKTPDADVIDLATLFTVKDHVLEALADEEISLGDLNISNEIFTRVFAEPSIDKLRKCEVFFSVRYAETYEYLEKLKGDFAAAKKSIIFHCGVDPEGQSIFKNTGSVIDPDDPRRSYTRGDNSQGHTFMINEAHAAYKYVESLGTEIREAYYQEQMIFHAARLAVQNKTFEGLLSEFAEEFDDESMSADESALKVDKLVGKIISKFRR